MGTEGQERKLEIKWTAVNLSPKGTVLHLSLPAHIFVLVDWVQNVGQFWRGRRAEDGRDKTNTNHDRR
jgi:hypothetical protein